MTKFVTWKITTDIDFDNVDKQNLQRAFDLLEVTAHRAVRHCKGTKTTIKQNIEDIT